LQSFDVKRQNKVQYVFAGSMYVGENTSRPASVPKGCAQQAAIPFFGKGLPFPKNKNITPCHSD
jgi:hypothetical protein